MSVKSSVTAPVGRGRIGAASRLAARFKNELPATFDAARAMTDDGGRTMRKLVIVAAAVAAAVAGGLSYRAATSEARWHILSGTAINTNRLCIDGLRYTYASGETTTQPPATRPVAAPWWVGPVAWV